MSQLSCHDSLYNKEMTGQLGASKSLNLRGLMIDGVHWRPIPKKLRGTTGKSLPFKETQFLQRHSAVPMSTHVPKNHVREETGREWTRRSLAKDNRTCLARDSLSIRFTHLWPSCLEPRLLSVPCNHCEARETCSSPSKLGPPSQSPRRRVRHWFNTPVARTARRPPVAGWHKAILQIISVRYRSHRKWETRSLV